MGEGINIYRENLKKRNGLAKTKMSKFGQNFARAERVLNKEIRSLQGDLVVMKSKKKDLSVKITRQGINHILHNIKQGHLPMKKKDLVKLKNYMENAEWADGKDSDKEGIHKKRKGESFVYFSFDYGDSKLYINVHHRRIIETGKPIRFEYELYTITKKIKNGQ